MIQPELLRATQAAEYLNVSLSTLASWRKAGIGPVIIALPSGRTAYARSDLDAFIRAHRQPQAIAE